MAEEQIVNPQTALDNLLDAELAEEQAQPEQEEVEDSAEEQTGSDEPQESTEETEPEEVDKIFLNDFAKDAEVDMQDVYELSVKMPNESDMTITELKNFRIDNNDIDQVRLELKNREEELQIQADSMRDVPQVSNELMNARARVLSIQDQYNRVNWDQIRQENPAEWSALQQDYRNQFEGAKAEEATATNKVDTQQSQARQFQQERLFESMPELRDDQTRQDAGLRVQKLASKYGFSVSDVANISDSRLMRLLIDASRQDIAVKEVKEKLIKTPPKANKPIRRVPTTRKASLNRLKDKAAATGDRRDIDKFLDAALS